MARHNKVWSCVSLRLPRYLAISLSSHHPSTCEGNRQDHVGNILSGRIWHTGSHTRVQFPQRMLHQIGPEVWILCIPNTPATHDHVSARALSPCHVEQTLLKEFTIHLLLTVSLVVPLLACRIYGWFRKVNDHRGVGLYGSISWEYDDDSNEMPHFTSTRS